MPASEHLVHRRFMFLHGRASSCVCSQSEMLKAREARGGERSSLHETPGGATSQGARPGKAGCRAQEWAVT
eukprot:768153-Hanusia_phi.AAC.1